MRPSSIACVSARSAYLPILLGTSLLRCARRLFQPDPLVGREIRNASERAPSRIAGRRPLAYSQACAELHSSFAVKSPTDPINTCFCVFVDLVFPQTHNGPAFSAQLREISSIPISVSFNLLFPSGTQTIAPTWKLPAVPKVAINKNCDRCGEEDHIRTPRQRHNMSSVSKASAICRPSYQFFYRSVHTLNFGHIPASLSGGYAIGH